MPWLWVHPPGAGPQDARAVEVPPHGLRLGREEDNDLVVADGSVSRHHARLVPGEGGWILEDLGSANGTWVDRERIQRCRLVPGQAFRVGDTRLVLVEAEAARTPTPEPPPVRAPPPAQVQAPIRGAVPGAAAARSARCSPRTSSRHSRHAAWPPSRPGTARPTGRWSPRPRCAW